MIKAMLLVLKADRTELDKLNNQTYLTLEDQDRVVLLKERIKKLERMLDEYVNEEN